MSKLGASIFFKINFMWKYYLNYPNELRMAENEFCANSNVCENFKVEVDVAH